MNIQPANRMNRAARERCLDDAVALISALHYDVDFDSVGDLVDEMYSDGARIVQVLPMLVSIIERCMRSDTDWFDSPAEVRRLLEETWLTEEAA